MLAAEHLRVQRLVGVTCSETGSDEVKPNSRILSESIWLGAPVNSMVATLLPMVPQTRLYCRWKRRRKWTDRRGEV
jgi:hypothetical protein